MRIALLGQFGSGNSGNDGSLESMIHFLGQARPDAELMCICSGPQNVSKAFHIPATGISSAVTRPRFVSRLNAILLGAPHRLGNLFEALRRTRGLDWMIVPGTGILDDYRDNPFGWPFVLLRWCVAARLNGARIAFVSVGAGPIHHPLSRRFLKWSARLAHYRSYRDGISHDFMRSIGFDVTSDPIVADVAFRLPLPRPTDAVPATRRIIGIGIMTYRGWSKKDDGEGIYQDYLGRLAQFVLRITDRGFGVRLLTGDTDDWTAVNDLQARLAYINPGRLQSHIVAQQAFSLADLIQQMSGADIIVASRYHNLVCALRLGLPTISLSYADKNDALLMEFGLGDFCQHIERFDVDILIQQFDRLVAEREGRSVGVRGALLKVVERLNWQEALLSREIGKNRPARPTVADSMRETASLPGTGRKS